MIAIPRKSFQSSILRLSVEAVGPACAVANLALIGAGLILLLPPILFTVLSPQFGIVVVVTFLVSVTIKGLLFEKGRVSIETSLKRKTLAWLHHTSLEFLSQTNATKTILRDLAVVRDFLAESFPESIYHFTLFFGSVFLLLKGRLFHLDISLIALAVLAILWLLVRQSRNPSASRRHEEMFNVLKQSIEGMGTIRTHSAAPYFERRFEAEVTALSSSTNRGRKLSRFLFGATHRTDEVGWWTITDFLIVIASTRLVGEASLSHVVLSAFYLSILFGSALSLILILRSLPLFFLAGRRVAGLLYSTRDLPVTTSRGIEPGFIPRCHSLSLSFRISSKPSEILFQLERGMLWAGMNAFDGHYSDLLEILAGLRGAESGRVTLYDAQGKVLYSQTSSHKLKIPIGLSAFAEKHPYLFRASLRENLTLGNPERLSDTILWKGLERVGLEGLVADQGGVDFYLSSDLNLTTGEKYRITLCRALLMRCPFLLLDDPFTALDRESSDRVVSVLNEEKKETGIFLTTFFIPPHLAIDGKWEGGESPNQPRAIERERTVVF